MAQQRFFAFAIIDGCVTLVWDGNKSELKRTFANKKEFKRGNEMVAVDIVNQKDIGQYFSKLNSVSNIETEWLRCSIGLPPLGDPGWGIVFK